MAQKTVNPYPAIGKQFLTGMDYVINNIPPGPTILDLVSTVQAYINTLTYFTPSPKNDLEIQSIAFQAIDDYRNAALYDLFDEEQIQLLYILIGPSIIDITTVDTIESRILDVERNIDNRGFTIDQQTPLYLATQIGFAANNYWRAKILVPGLWAPYFSTALVSTKVNMQNWVVAGMEGALLGEKSTEKGMIDPTTDIIINKIVQSLIYALTISAGKVIFKWIPRIQSPSQQSFSIIVPRDYSTARAIINQPQKYEPYNLRTMKVGGFANSSLSLILGNTIEENNLLQYAADNQIYQLQFFDLRHIFGDTIKEGILSDFIFKARSSPYHVGNIGCIMGHGHGGFADALNYNGSQPKIRQFNIFNKENEWWSGMLIQFKIVSGQTNVDYVLEINGFPCLFHSLNSITSDIAIGLVNAINSNGSVNAHLTASISPNDPDVIWVEADSTLNPFTYNIPNTALIGIWDITGESYADWIGSLNWLRQQINFYNYKITISAYVQNYNADVWTPTTAADMVAVVDDIEATNYNAGIPSATSLINRIISRVAPAAFAAGKIQKIRPLISAEYYLPDHQYSGQYLGQNGMKATEVQWRNTYNANNFANKSYINISGYAYFDYANMLANNVVK